MKNGALEMKRFNEREAKDARVELMYHSTIKQAIKEEIFVIIFMVIQYLKTFRIITS